MATAGPAARISATSSYVRSARRRATSVSSARLATRTQSLFVDLAAIVLRQIVDELDDARILVLCKLTTHVVLELDRERLRLRVSGPEDDERFCLHEALVVG